MSASGVVLSNARVVLADRVIGCGWVAVMNGRIVEVGEGDAPERGKDLPATFFSPAWWSYTRITSRNTICRGPEGVLGTRSRRARPSPGSSRPAASPPCSIFLAARVA